MRVGIIGTGLIGGSLAAALYGKNNYEISCFNRRVEVSKKAKTLKLVNNYFDSIEKLAANSDVIIIATPLGTYTDIAKKLSKYLDGKKIISDVGSVKFLPTENVIKQLPAKYKSFFVPAHPIAGKEKSRLENADKNLFKDKKVIICKTANCKKGKIISQLWNDAGAKVELVNAKKHDEICAFVSHYVQFLSFILAKIFPHNMGEFSRLMRSPHEIWSEIFEYNRANLKKVHQKFITSFLRELKYINSYKGKNEYEIAAKIIANSYKNIVPKEYARYAGTGYKSFTSPLSQAIDNGNKADAKKVSKILNKVYEELQKARL